MPYEHDAPPVHDEPKPRVRRGPEWWTQRTLPGFVLALVLLAVAWFTGLARGGTGPLVAVGCVVLAELVVWTVRKVRA